MKVFGNGVTNSVDFRIGVSKDLVNWVYITHRPTLVRAGSQFKQWTVDDGALWSDGVDPTTMVDPQ